MTIANTHQVLPQDGALYDSTSPGTNYYTVLPDGNTTGPDLAKRPVAGAWVAFTVYPNFNKWGYAVGLIEGTTTKVRIPLADHPDGG